MEGLGGNTFLPEVLIIDIALDIIVKLGIIISSFLFSSKLFTAISRAAVPLETAQANFLLTNLASLFSNNLIFFPDEDIQPFFTPLYVLSHFQMGKIITVYRISQKY